MFKIFSVWWHIRKLRSENVDIRKAAIVALGNFGDPRAVEPLIKTFGIGDSRDHHAAAEALIKFGQCAVEPLIEALGDENSRGRCAAAEALGKLGDKRAVEPLIKTLGNTDESVRRAATEALGNLGDTRAVEPLVATLIDTDSDVRHAAAEALGRLGDTRALEPLIKALGNTDEFSRRAAAEALGKLGETRAVEPLVETLIDTDSDVRHAAAEALIKLGDKRAIEPLIKGLGNADKSIRRTIAEVMGSLGEPKWNGIIKGDDSDFERLGDFGDRRAVEPLIKALGDKNCRVRYDAVEALVKLGQCAVEPLIKALDDWSEFVRCAAVKALGKLGDKRAVEPLIKALGDTDSDVRKNSAQALDTLGEPKWKEIAGRNDDYIKWLGDCGDPRAVEPLIKALGFRDKSVHRCAAMALGKLGDKRAVEPLINTLGFGDESIRRAVTEALSKLGEPKWMNIVKGDNSDFKRLGDCGDPRVIEPLINALSDKAEFVRHAVTEVLGNLGDKRAVEPLIKALNDWDETVRRAVAEALCKLGDKRAVEPLIKALGDRKGLVRRVVAEVLSKLGDPRWTGIVKGEVSDFMRLGGCGDPHAFGPLINALGTGDEFVRRAVTEALGRFGDKRAVEPLIKALGNMNITGQNWDRDVRCATQDAILMLADPRTVDLLIIQLKNERRWTARRYAAEVLSEIAAAKPNLLRGRWAKARAIVTQTHDDRLSGISHDCSSVEHGDQGIGGTFPPPPPGLDF